MPEKLTVGSLFSGIPTGGIDLGLERAGMRVLWQVENDPYCTKVLAKHWPEVTRYGDIQEVDFERVEHVDILAGGFPCQPVSLAGKGLAQADDRWLWPEFARAIRVVRPRYVLVENVPGLLGRGFGDVLGDLAALGFDAAWQGIPAAVFGAPHLRDRIWIVAHTSIERWGTGRPRRLDTGDSWQSEPTFSTVADTRGERCDRRAERDVFPQTRLQAPRRHYVDRLALAERTAWESAPAVRRVAHGIPRQVDRLRGLGNAVVPQVVEWIGRRIVEFDAAVAS